MCGNSPGIATSPPTTSGTFDVAQCNFFSKTGRSLKPTVVQIFSYFASSYSRHSRNKIKQIKCYFTILIEEEE